MSCLLRRPQGGPAVGGGVPTPKVALDERVLRSVRIEHSIASERLDVPFNERDGDITHRSSLQPAVAPPYTLHQTSALPEGVLLKTKGDLEVGAKAPRRFHDQ